MSKNNQHERRDAATSQGKQPPDVTPLMVEDKRTEQRKKRARDAGLITNAGADKAAGPPSKKKDGKK